MRPVHKIRPEQLYTVEEYLEFERQSEERHEYIDGVIRAMAGESPEHSTINVNLTAVIRDQLKGTHCRPFSPNMKVRSGHPIKQQRRHKGLFSYADLTIVCDEPKFYDSHRDVLLNPVVVFEILSASTELFDRGEKFWRYRSHNETLTDYVLISQNYPLVEHYRRQPNGQWLLNPISGLDGVLKIDSIDCRLPLAELYYGVEFPALKKPKAKPKSKKAKKQKGAKKG